MHNISKHQQHGGEFASNFQTHKLLRSASFALRHLKNNKKIVHIILIGNSLTRTHVHISMSVSLSLLLSVCNMCQIRPPHEDSDIWAWLYDWANQFGSAIILCYLFAQVFHNDMWAAPYVVFKCGCQGSALFMVSSLSLSAHIFTDETSPESSQCNMFCEKAANQYWM